MEVGIPMCVVGGEGVSEQVWTDLEGACDL